jgi:hypothetical protein
MNIRIEIDERVSQRFDELSRDKLREARRDMVEEALRQTLGDTIRVNPVDTGRSRAAWVSALRQLGASPPDGWQGSHPDAGAISQGAGRGLLEIADEESRSAASAVNAVDYVGYLEYGTSRMAPFAMARQALLRVQQSVAALFHFP